MRKIIDIAIIIAVITIVSLPTVGNNVVDQAVGPMAGAAVVAGRKGGNRRNIRRNNQGSASVTQKPRPQVPSGVQRVSGSVTNIMETAQREGNVFASALKGSSETVVYVDNRTAVVFGHDQDAWIYLATVLAGHPGNIEVRGRMQRASSSRHDVFGVDIVIERPLDVRFQRFSLEGQADEGVDTVISLGEVSWGFQEHRTVEVPSTGYCIRCKASVYRRDLQRVYIDRYGDGMWDEETYFESWKTPYANATRGICPACDATVVRFGTQETQIVRVNDLAMGFVRPVRKVALPKAVTPEGAIPNPAGYCFKCKYIVQRRNVEVTTFSNGRSATVGNCERCETRVYRAGGPELPDVVIHVQNPAVDDKAGICGDGRARFVGNDPEAADSLYYLESLDYTQFVVMCAGCEERIGEADSTAGGKDGRADQGYPLRELVAFARSGEWLQEQDESAAVAVAPEAPVHTCPDDVRVADRPVPAYDTEGYFRNRSVATNGDVFEFTAYTRTREPWYTCYSGDGNTPSGCRNPAGWHGFRRPRGLGSDEYHLCSRHWRVAMGYSPK